MNSCEIPDSEEEVLLYVELGDDVELEQFKSVNILGVNTKNPVIQMNDNVFMGKYQIPIGTYMFFRDAPPPLSSDPVFDKVPERNFEYLCKTRKLIKMEHAYMKPISNTEQNTEDNQRPCYDTIEPVNFTVYENALEKFKSYWESVSSEKSNKNEINL